MEGNLHLTWLRNAVSYTHWNSNGYTDRDANSNTYCDAKCNTEPEPHGNSYSRTYFNAAAPPDATSTADSKDRGQSVADES